MKPETTPKLPSPSDPPSTRFAWVLHVIFAGSQGEMAKALRCSQSIISRIVRGRQEPGAKLLMTLAEYPAVNRVWVLTGKGEPLAAQVANYEGDAALPIAREPFIGLPYDNPLCLDDVLYPIPRKFHRNSRYCFRMTMEHPFVNDGKLKITCEDVVVFEADENEWPDNFLDRPCLVQVTLETSPHLVFSRCCSRSKNEWTTHDFDCYDQIHVEMEDATKLADYEGRSFRSVSPLSEACEKPISLARPVELVAVAIFRLGRI